MKYKTKLVEIEAFKLPDNANASMAPFISWCHEHECYKGFHWIQTSKGITIITLEGNMEANPGDYIVKGLLGEFYPCKPDAFERKYEPT